MGRNSLQGGPLSTVPAAQGFAAQVDERLAQRPLGLVRQAVGKGLLSGGVERPPRPAAQSLCPTGRGADGALDDAQLVEKIGKKVKVLPGDPRNIKITQPTDLEMGEKWIEEISSEKL